MNNEEEIIYVIADSRNLKNMNVLNIDSKSLHSLPIDIGTKLNIELDLKKIKYDSSLIGFMKNSYIIISFPKQIDNLKKDIMQDKKTIIKYLWDGNIMAFQTQLIDIIYEPVKLLFLKYPKTIQKVPLRSDKRNECMVPAKIALFKNNSIDPDTKNGVIKDISKKGCQYLLKLSPNQENHFKQNDPIALLCHFPGSENEKMVLGVIKNIQVENEKIFVGIQFQELSSDFTKAMDYYILSIQDFV